MKIAALTPMLQTEKFKETLSFYIDVLAFKLNHKMEDANENILWAAVGKDDVEIMFSAPNDHIPFTKANFTGSFYFRVEGVDNVWQLLKDKAPVCYALEVFDYGMKEFAIYDPNGYILQFGQAV